MRPNKVEKTVQWFHMSHAVLARFSGHGNFINKNLKLIKFKDLVPSLHLDTDLISMFEYLTKGDNSKYF